MVSTGVGYLVGMHLVAHLKFYRPVTTTADTYLVAKSCIVIGTDELPMFSFNIFVIFPYFRLHHPVKKFKPAEPKAEEPLWPPYRPAHIQEHMEVIHRAEPSQEVI